MINTQKRLVSGNHEVGYCKPPEVTRFKKGISGNPAGRPKGAKNKVKAMQTKLNKLVTQEAHREIEINERGTTIKMPVVGAVLRSVGIKAAKGHVGAQRLFLEVANTAETMELHEKQETFKAAVHYKRAKYSAIAEAKANGEPKPVFLPDPDDVVLNEYTLGVIIHGPKDDGEKREWDLLWAQMDARFEDIEKRREQLSNMTEEFERPKIAFELEVGLYLFKLKALEIMQRWQLPASRLVKDRQLRAELHLHIMNNTKPISPFV